MSNLDSDLRAALSQEPDKKKSLVKLIIDNWDAIEDANKSGITFKNIAHKMNIDYSYFINARQAAKKKIEKGHAKNKAVVIPSSDTNSVDAINSNEETESKPKQTIKENKTGAKLVGDFDFSSLNSNKDR